MRKRVFRLPLLSSLSFLGYRRPFLPSVSKKSLSATLSLPLALIPSDRETYETPGAPENNTYFTQKYAEPPPKVAEAMRSTARKPFLEREHVVHGRGGPESVPRP